MYFDQGICLGIYLNGAACVIVCCNFSDIHILKLTSLDVAKMIRL